MNEVGGTLGFVKQQVFCSNCGTPFKTDFQKFDGQACSQSCWDGLHEKRERAMDSETRLLTEPRPLAKRKPQPI